MDRTRRLIISKYCPSARIKCYRVMARDPAARPHELLSLKIKDVMFKISPNKEQQYAEVLVNVDICNLHSIRGCVCCRISSCTSNRTSSTSK
jgi:hypothetical protein